MRSRGAPLAGIAALAALLGLGGCEELNWPFHRAHTASDTPPAAGGDSVSAECTDLLTQIRTNEEARREAPTISTNPDIVDAAKGKADKRIEELQQRYDELDCPAADAAANKPGRQPPLQPAPGGGNR